MFLLCVDKSEHPLRNFRQQMPELTKAFCCSSRFAMLLLALAVPCGSPAVAESLRALESETETTTEACKECVYLTSQSQMRRKHWPVGRLASEPFACQTRQLHGRHPARVFLKHRLSHELLAPLRC